MFLLILSLTMVGVPVTFRVMLITTDIVGLAEAGFGVWLGYRHGNPDSAVKDAGMDLDG